MIELRRRVMVQEATGDTKYVDLGLPSGLLWAKGPICKDSQGNYSIDESETGYGAYFSWANIVGHREGEGYDFSQTTYNSTPGYSQNTDITYRDAQHNAPYALFGSPWRLPSLDECRELCENTTCSFAYKGSTKFGIKFTSKTDASKYIIIPLAGRYSGTSQGGKGKYFRIWCSTRASSGNGQSLQMENLGSPNYTNYSPYLGNTIIPVRSAT